MTRLFVLAVVAALCIVLIFQAAAQFSPTPTLLSGALRQQQGNIPCGIGPSFSGSIPAAAQNAGLTTCAANFDFTSSQFSNPATYVACLGASTPQFYCNEPGGAMVVPSSNISVVTDTGVTPNTQALKLHLGATDPTTYCTATNNCATLLDTVNANFTAIASSFPNGSYYEAVYRFTPVNAGGSRCNVSGSEDTCNYTAFWSWSTVNTNATEKDFIETFGPITGGYDAAWHNYANSDSAFVWQGSSNFPGGYDQTAYSTYSALVTSDGSTSTIMCSFINNTQAGSSCSAVDTTTSGYSQRMSVILQNAIVFLSTPIINLSADQNMFVKSIRVWSCTSWATGQCYGSTKITSGNLTYWK